MLVEAGVRAGLVQRAQLLDHSGLVELDVEVRRFVRVDDLKRLEVGVVLPLNAHLRRHDRVVFHVKFHVDALELDCDRALVELALRDHEDRDSRLVVEESLEHEALQAVL